MSKNKNDSGEVRESRVAYKAPSRLKNRKAIERAIKIQDEIHKRHANDPDTGRDSVSIIREWRDRRCTS